MTSIDLFTIFFEVEEVTYEGPWVVLRNGTGRHTSASDPGATLSGSEGRILETRFSATYVRSVKIDEVVP